MMEQDLLFDEYWWTLSFFLKLDIRLLDEVVEYNGLGQLPQIAVDVLTALKKDPDARRKVYTILGFSQNLQTEYIALQILEEDVMPRWRFLLENQRKWIKKCIVAYITKTSSDPTLAIEGKTYLGKIKVILIHLLKQDLLTNWLPSIREIIAKSRINENFCQNTMDILNLMSEKLFYLPQRIQKNTKDLRDLMCDEIFHLCQFVLDNSQNAPLVDATLDTLLLYLNWIRFKIASYSDKYILSLKDIFETELILKLVDKFLTMPMFRNITWRCLTEIVKFYVVDVQKFFLAMTQWKQMLPTTTDMESAYANSSNYDQNFILIIASFLCIFLKKHVNLIEKTPEIDALLLDVHLLMISRMAKPEEVLVVVKNEQGEVVEEFIQDTDSSSLYTNMRDALNYLTHLDDMDTERIMTEKLHNQVNGTEWSWKNLNSLCWAIGSISVAMHEEDEKIFIDRVLIGLLNQKCKIEDNWRIIASNIMFIVCQYPRYLRSNWTTLKTIMDMLITLMHDTHDGIKDMACNTVLKLVEKCLQHFVQSQEEDVMAFIKEIINNIIAITEDLQPQQINTFFEAVICMIYAQAVPDVRKSLGENVLRIFTEGRQEIKIPT